MPRRHSVTPQAAPFIRHANTVLERADVMLRAGQNEDAARTAYLASFHMAQAYIFERTGRSSKTHHGVRREFFRLTKDDARTDPELRRLLARSTSSKWWRTIFPDRSPL
jgi:uncharacterized protein (UPF0332 family)